MRIDKVIHALNASTRREIMKLLAEKSMSAPEVFKQLGDKGPEHRPSVNKALEVLKESGLLTKYYDNQDNQIKYKLTSRRVTIDFKQMEIVEVEEES